MADVNEMMHDLQAADSAGDTALAQHIASLIKAQQGGAQPPKTSGAITGLRDLGGAANSFLAGDLQFTHNIPFVGDALMTGARYARDALAGEHPTWDRAKGEVQTILNSGQAQHPIASGVGTVAGAVDSAVMAGGALKAASGGEAVFTALPKAATTAGKLANAARLAAAGATAGAAQGGAQGASNALTAGQNVVTGAEKGAAEGAVAGAVVGPVAAGAVSAAKAVVKPLAAKTASALSKMFGENAADLQAAWSTFKTTTGRAPTMAEMATLKQRGEIAGAAKNSQPITAALTQAADDAAAARSANMQQTFAPGAQSSGEAENSGATQVQHALAPGAPGPATAAEVAAESNARVRQALVAPSTDAASSGELANAKTAQGDIDYPAARQHSFTIPTDEDAALGGISASDYLASQVLPSAGLRAADRVRITTALRTGVLSGQDAQLIRSGINETLHRSYSPAVAGHLQDLDSFLAAPGNEAANDALAVANQNFAAGAQRQAGAAHGESILGSQTADNFIAEAQSKNNANPHFTGGLQTGGRAKLAAEAATPAGASSLARRFATDDDLYRKGAHVLGGDVAATLRAAGQRELGAAHGERVFGADTADNFLATAQHPTNQNPAFSASFTAAAKAKLAAEAASPEGAAQIAKRFATDDDLYRKGSAALGVDTAAALRQAGNSSAGVTHGEAVLAPGSSANYVAESAAKPNANPNFQGGVEPGQRSALTTASATPQGAERLAGRLATDDNLHAKLVSGLGQDSADAFRRLGQAESAAAENTNALARRTPPAEDQDGKDVNTALRGLATFASHGVYKFYHGAKALAGIGMSPAVQEKVAQYLSDPKMTQQGINLLRKAGASNAQLRQLAMQAAANSGAVAGQVATDTVGP